MKKFTTVELEIMELFWSVDAPLTSAAISERSPDRSWRRNSLYLHLNALLKAGAIEVVGKVQAGRTHARLFQAAISRADYAAMQIADDVAARVTDENVELYLGTMIRAKQVSPEMLQKLNALIEERLEEIK